MKQQHSSAGRLDGTGDEALPTGRLHVTKEPLSSPAHEHQTSGAQHETGDVLRSNNTTPELTAPVKPRPILWQSSTILSYHDFLFVRFFLPGQGGYGRTRSDLPRLAARGISPQTSPAYSEHVLSDLPWHDHRLPLPSRPYISTDPPTPTTLMNAAGYDVNDTPRKRERPSPLDIANGEGERRRSMNTREIL